MKLFKHQEEMIAAAAAHNKGILQAPTGSGKTFAQAGIVADLLKNEKFSVTVVKTPRIGLSNQVASEYTKYISSLGLNFNTMLIHSGQGPEIDSDSNKSFEEQMEELGGLNELLPRAKSHMGDLIDEIKRSRELNVPYVIFTTYHSNQKVYETLEREGFDVDLDINDEAHYLVREDFSRLLDNPRAKRQYFFTATLIVTESDDGKGMLNVERFGRRIYEMPIAEAIEKGLILPVKPLAVRSELEFVSQDEVDQGVGQLVLKGFEAIETRYDNIAAKMLVAVRGSRQIDILLNSDEFETLLSNGVQILTVHSKKEYLTHNGNQITRTDFDKLKDELGGDPNTRLIIVHYDILAEGIDVPGLLGVMILRNMKEAKFLQTIGRVIRVYRKDPSAKKYGSLLIPNINDPDLAANFSEMVARMTESGYLPQQQLEEYLTMGTELEDEELDQLEDRSISGVSGIDLRLYTVYFTPLETATF